jgi:endo-1,4-beta-xylanase
MMQRAIFSYLLGLTSFGLLACGSDSDDTSVPDDRVSSMTLRLAAEPTERLIGVALATRKLMNPSYADAAREFSFVTPENELKWDSVEHEPGVFTFENADTTLAFVEQNGMQMRGHTLVWHSQLADWVKQLTTREEVLAAMERHISEVVGHYKGRIRAWDVVNEAFTDGMMPRLRGSDPNDADPMANAGTNGPDSIFRRLIGEDYIDRAFIAAKAADPDALLFYNDYNAEGAGAKSDAIFAMVSGMLARGVPIDGVGLQMHINTAPDNRSPEQIASNMQRLADLGLQIHVTELDVSLCGDQPIEERRTLQQARWAGIVETCLEQPQCSAVTTWGVSDGDSWRDQECNGGRSEPLLFDANYQRKEAYFAVFDTLMAHAPARPATAPARSTESPGGPGGY